MMQREAVLRLETSKRIPDLTVGAGALAAGQRVEVPTGFANYPGETYMLAPPRSWCERSYNMQYWSDMPRGGHFAAMEVPDLYVEDLRRWARALPPEAR